MMIRNVSRAALAGRLALTMCPEVPGDRVTYPALEVFVDGTIKIDLRALLEWIAMHDPDSYMHCVTPDMLCDRGTDGRCA